MNYKDFFIQEFVVPILNYKYWMVLAETSIKQKYNRTILGPLWTTFSTLIQVLSMGLVFTYLFQNKIERFLPYVTLGIIFWNFFTITITQGCYTFMTHKSYMIQFQKPIFIYVLVVLYQNKLIFLHNFVVFFGVAVLFDIYPSFLNLIQFICNLFIVLLTLSWISLLVAIICVRFRDVPHIIGSLFTVLFWVTPIIYNPEQLGNYAYLLNFNPLTHILELLRNCLLNQDINAISYKYLFFFNVIGLYSTFLIFKKLKNSIIFWV